MIACASAEFSLPLLQTLYQSWVNIHGTRAVAQALARGLGHEAAADMLDAQRGLEARVLVEFDVGDGGLGLREFLECGVEVLGIIAGDVGRSLGDLAVQVQQLRLERRHRRVSAGRGVGGIWCGLRRASLRPQGLELTLKPTSPVLRFPAQPRRGVVAVLGDHHRWGVVIHLVGGRLNGFFCLLDRRFGFRLVYRRGHRCVVGRNEIVSAIRLITLVAHLNSLMVKQSSPLSCGGLRKPLRCSLSSLLGPIAHQSVVCSPVCCLPLPLELGPTPGRPAPA